MFDTKYENLLKRSNCFNADSYVHSLLYYKITGRKSAWIYQHKENCLVVCQHPHDNQVLLVFPEIGNKAFDLTFFVLCALYRSNHKIRLARYTHNDYQQLKSKIETESMSTIEQLNIVPEDQLDWLYPVHIYDTKKVSDMQGPAFNRIRAKYKKVDKQNVEVVPLNKDTAVRDMRAALKYWEGSMIANNKDTDNMSEFYERFFSLLDYYGGAYDGLLYFQGRKPLGFVVWDQINETQANSFINLADISISGLSDFQTVTTCRTLAERNVKFLNVGGSETENLDQFKVKFQPDQSIQLLSIDVQYKDFKSPDINMSKFI